MTLSVYPASHTHLAPLWLSLANDWPEVHFCARWPSALHGGRPDTPEFATVGWQENVEDITRADVILVYSDSYTLLRGALVEAGMGIALGKKVLLVGKHPSFGTWQYHPQCYGVRELEGARDRLADWAARERIEGDFTHATL